MQNALTVRRYRRRFRFATILGACLLLAPAGLRAQAPPAWGRTNPAFADIDLRETLRPSALKDRQSGPIILSGNVRDANLRAVTLRITTGRGQTLLLRVPVQAKRFRALYPRDFPGAPELAPGVLFLDATAGDSFAAAAERPSAEATLIVYDSRKQRLPDYPCAFTTDLRDSQGQHDSQSAQWPAMRALVNLYMRSYGARLAGVGKPDFDLDRPADFTAFKTNLALYDFDGRDRDWSVSHKPRVARTFWKSVWSSWFNASNDHPLDGNPANATASNYLPYAFTNDFADLLIAHLLRSRLTDPTEGDLTPLCREALANLLACQHREPTNFALPDASGHRETYTAGAFRYGMFVNGDFMTEGKGWFYNPAFRDYAGGGVINGRAVWALGEGLRAEPKGPLADRLKEALAAALQFCLNDALSTGYAHRTEQGHVYWRDAGEHAYLTLGMVNACAVAPEMAALKPAGKPALTLRAACVEALNALIDLQQAHGQWAVYPNVDSMAIVALAEGALVLPDQPDAKRWRQAAEQAANGWMAAKVDPKEFRGPTVHFGLRLTPETMTYRWSRLDPKGWGDRNYLFFYQTGHWIHALARLYSLTGDSRYRQRAEAMVAYLCGDNPWGVRLLNEMGGVYNWVEDRDGDGVEDQLKQDMYPESTAFCQIGLFHLLQAEVRR